jgi:hypothetical protein
MPQPEEGLRIEIGERWSAREMSGLLADISAVYEVRLSLDYDNLALEMRRTWFNQEAPSGAVPFAVDLAWMPPLVGEDPLRVQAIEYGSPGFVDLVGIGKVVEQVRLFVEKLIDLSETRRRSRLENASLAQDVSAKEIANARSLVQLTVEARLAGLNEEDIDRLVQGVDGIQGRLLDHVERGQITAAVRLESPQTGPG